MNKFLKYYFVIRAVLFIAIAVMIAVFANQLFEYLNYLVGGVILLYGFEGLFMPITRTRSRFFTDYQFYLGLVELLLGIMMICVVKDFNNVCMIWATWTIVRESFELYETSHKLLKKFPAVLSLSLSIIEIVFSILLIIFASEHHAMTHIYLLIPEFIINGISPLLFKIYLSYRKRQATNN